MTQHGEQIGPLSLGHPMRRTEMRVQPWVFGLRARPVLTMGSEVTDAFWLSVPGLPKTATTSEVEIRGERRTVESFFVNHRVVWGFTYRVLTELLQIPGIL